MLQRISQATLILSSFLFATPVLSEEKQQLADTPFWQEVAVRYVPEVNLADYELRSIRADRDGRVLINTDKGLLKATDERLVQYREMQGIEKLNHFDLEILGGKFVFLTEKFLLPLHKAGADYLANGDLGLIRVAPLGPSHFVLLSPKDIVEYKDGKTERFPNDEFTEITTDFQGKSIVLWNKTKVGFYEGKGKVTLIPTPGIEITDVLNDGDKKVTIGTPKGLFSLGANNKLEPVPKIPTEVITSIARDPVRGWLWVGTTDGLFRRDSDGLNSYYVDNRWLPDNHIIDVTFDADGDVFVLTKKGVVELRFKKMTLEEKADIYTKNLRQHHIRFGLVSDASTPNGDYANVQMHDSDNDGLWSSMYLASEAFRYAVTKKETAKENLMDGLDALEQLVRLPTVEGFQARSFELDGFRQSDPDAWRKRPQADFEWKGTTSSDEITGTMFFYSVLYETLGKNDPELKKRIGGLVGAVIGHIVDHDLYILDTDGKPTRWGFWNPENINTPVALHDRRLNSIEILGFLQLAYELTKEEKFKTTYDSLVDKFRYDRNTLHYLPDPLGPWNHSDDELYWLAYYVLLRYPIRESLSPTFVKSAEEQLVANQRKRNPLWNAIYGSSTHRPIDIEGIAFWLREFPIDMRGWHSRNSHRKDVVIDQRPFVRPEAKELLPPDERVMQKWNGNEMNLDGGGQGNSAESGAEYLLPYWMARYYGYISAPKPE